ncbi:MAG: MucR family transcriptional regulator [Rhodospirillaceae bacterium]|nr:MucR family transcriptional regulator [Rhodospirillaceae bacterium]MBT3927827.1 MucR family transcriptional regulator [Rhodospirillaceae bacterium]MBT4428648.1 MucR family transcriptional regulator [Rhodospirillaceae bacterium]MBT5040276.1 MucR family transcriptional regulator [Rhodospirillaceae bacterium]MBT5677813.1 MucR family transcriptional regulator [Rhodospirillaceae bacterium]
MVENTGPVSLVALTSSIVAAYVSNNKISVSELPDLIRSVHESFQQADQSNTSNTVDGNIRPATTIKKSITPDYLICMEDGIKLKMLKRHLRTHYGLTPQQYREKWGLPADYPMVAPNYAAKRSRLAKEIGLGAKRGGAGRKKDQAKK